MSRPSIGHPATLDPVASRFSARSPLRVVHVIQRFEMGGLEAMVLNLCRATRSSGVESLVVAYESDGPFRSAFTLAGVRTAVVAEGSGLRPSVVAKLARLFVKFGADVVHTHHLGPLMYGGIAARMTGSRLVHTAHSVEFLNTPRRIWAARVAGRGAAVISVSRAVAAARTAITGRPSAVVNNGVVVPTMDDWRHAVECREALGLPRNVPVIGCVARLSAEKDHALLLRAFEKVADEHDVHLAVIGDGPLRDKLEAQRRTLRSADRVHLLGAKKDASRLVAAFSMVALTSEREGQPLALLEAMAAGRPIVATAVGGMPELVEGCGTLAHQRTAESVASALSALLRDPLEARRLGLAGREKVRATFSVAAMAAAYLSHYEDDARGLSPLRLAA